MTVSQFTLASEANTMTSFRIHAISGSNLLKLDADASDPYLQFTLKSEGKKSRLTTRVIKNDLNPVWNETFVITPKNESDVLVVELKDKDMFKDDPMMDTLEFPLDSITAENKLEYNADIKLTDKEAGHINFTVERITPETENQAPQLYYYDILAVKAQNLLKLDADASDPYLLFYFKGSGKGKAQKTNVIQNDCNPVWNQHLSLSTPCANDTLVVEMWDEDISKDDPMMNELQFPISEEKRTEPIHFNDEIQLKDKAAGHLEFWVNAVNNEGDTVEPPEEKQTYGFEIHAINAQNLLKLDANASDPYLLFYFKDAKEFTFRTKAIKDNCNPEWNETIKVTTNNPDDTLVVELYDKDIKNDDSMMDPIEFPLSRIINEPVDFDNDIFNKGQPAGHLHFTINYLGNVQTRDIVLDDLGDCHFAWGEYDSSFSTSFTGYSQCSKTLDDILNSGDYNHIHVEVTQETEGQNPMQKPKRIETVTGTLVGFEGLQTAPADNLNIYATVQLIGRSAISKGKGALVQTDVEHTESPSFNKEFNLEHGRKGDYLNVFVYQDHPEQGLIKIGNAKIPIKDYNEGPNEAVEIEVTKPKQHGEEKVLEGHHDSYGKVKISINRKEDFVERQPAEQAPAEGQPAEQSAEQPAEGQ